MVPNSMLDGGAAGADMVPNPKYTWWSYGNRFDVQASHVKQKNEKKIGRRHNLTHHQ